MRITDLLADFETVIDAPAADVAPADTPAVDAPAAVDDTAAVDTQPAAPDAGYDQRALQAEIEYLREQQQQQAQMWQTVMDAANGGDQGQQFGPAGLGQPLQDPFQGLDPFADDYGANLGRAITAAVQQANQPVIQMIQQQQQSQVQAQQQAEIAHGEQLAQDVIADEIARNGDLPGPLKDMIWPQVKAVVPEFFARYGYGDRAVELAIEHVAGRFRQAVGLASQNGVTQHTQHLAQLASAAHEPGSSIAGVQGIGQFNHPSEVTAHYAARMRARAGQTGS